MRSRWAFITILARIARALMCRRCTRVPHVCVRVFKTYRRFLTMCVEKKCGKESRACMDACVWVFFFSFNVFPLGKQHKQIEKEYFYALAFLLQKRQRYVDVGIRLHFPGCCESENSSANFQTSQQQQQQSWKPWDATSTSTCSQGFAMSNLLWRHFFFGSKCP